MDAVLAGTYAQISGIAVKHGFGPLLGLGAPAGGPPASPPTRGQVVRLGR